jgi:acetyltransferase-like isoleucine patch superfamily enzyme
MQTKTLGELAQYVDGQIIGNPGIMIKSASTLERAGEGDISFLANIKYEKLVQKTKAGAVIVGREYTNTSGVALLVAEDPYYAFMQILVLLHGHRKHKKVDISPRASICDTARIGADCQIHNFVTIEDNAKVGNNCILYPGVYIGADAQVGNDCIIYPNVTIYDGCRIGNRVIIRYRRGRIRLCNSQRRSSQDTAGRHCDNRRRRGDRKLLCNRTRDVRRYSHRSGLEAQRPCCDRSRCKNRTALPVSAAGGNSGLGYFRTSLRYRRPGWHHRTYQCRKLCYGRCQGGRN